MNYILVIWTVVGFQATGNAAYSHARYDWRPLGEFKSDVACVHAARELGYRGGERFRCLPTATKDQK